MTTLPTTRVKLPNGQTPTLALPADAFASEAAGLKYQIRVVRSLMAHIRAGESPYTWPGESFGNPTTLRVTLQPDGFHIARIARTARDAIESGTPLNSVWALTPDEIVHRFAPDPKRPHVNNRAYARRNKNQIDGAFKRGVDATTGDPFPIHGKRELDALGKANALPRAYSSPFILRHFGKSIDLQEAWNAFTRANAEYRAGNPTNVKTPKRDYAANHARKVGPTMSGMGTGTTRR